MIRVEPPGGSKARRCGPLGESGKGTGDSLQFMAYNRNKRSIVLDLDDDCDQAILAGALEVPTST